MESAFMFVEKWVETPSEEQGSHLDQLKRMVAKRDAAIRKECADRAVAWVEKDVVNHHGLRGDDRANLRAAIEGNI